MENTPSNATELPLKDIHLPDPVSWWPLAPGWWIIAGTILFLVILFFVIRAYYRSKALLRDANAELEQIKHNFILHKDQTELVQSLSILLRRSCISFYPRHETASLTGDDWLKFLDTTLPPVSSNVTTFYDGIGEILASAPYMNASTTPKVACHDLIILCEIWLLAQPVNKRTLRTN